MRKLPLAFIAAGLFATCAMATSVGVPYTTTGTTMSFLFADGGGDTFDLLGQSGVLDLSTTTATTLTIFNGMYITRSTYGTGVRSFDLIYDLNLAGVSQTITQPAEWTITWGPDTFTAQTALSPVTFDTPFGEWDVIAEAFTIDNGAEEGMVPFSIEAEFVPRTSVPEPGAFGVLGAALAGVAVFRRKQSART